MMTRQEIIDGLNGIDAVPVGVGVYVTKCSIDDFNKLLKAAAEALTQTARLVTEDDFFPGDEEESMAIPCWKETKSPTRRSGWAVIVHGKMLADRETGVARYWTLRPTDAQRQQTPWEG